MATIYTVKGPDGQLHDFEGPDNVSQADVLAAAQIQFGNAKRSPQESISGGGISELTQKTIDYYKNGGQKEDQLLPEQGKRLRSAVQQVHDETGNGKALLGAGETILNLATGLGSAAVGGWRAIGALASGQGVKEAQRVNQQTIEDYTYQPRLGIGKLGTELATLPFTALKTQTIPIGRAVGQALGGKSGGEIGEAVGDIGPDVIGTIAGGRAVARRFSGKVPVPLSEAPKSTPAPVNYDIPAYARKGIPDPVLTPIRREPVVPAAVNAVDDAAEAAVAQRRPVEPILAEVDPLPAPAGAISPLARIEVGNPEAGIAAAIPQAAVAATEAAPRSIPVGLRVEAGNPEALVRGLDDVVPLSAPPGSISPLARIESAERPAVQSLQEAKVQNAVDSLRSGDDITATLRAFGLDDAAAPVPAVRPIEPVATIAQAAETRPFAPLADESAPAPTPSILRQPEEAMGGNVPPPVEFLPEQPRQRMFGPGNLPPERPRMDIPGQPPRSPEVVRVEPPATRQAAPTIPARATIADAATQEKNLETLRSVGIENARKSAVEGDIGKAAEQYQSSKFTSEPAGKYWQDHFASERDTLAAHARAIIDDTKAISGLDEQSMQAKGQAIAAPYDAARGYFERAKTALYDEANERAAAAGKPVDTVALDSLLENKGFKATILAKNQQNLLDAIRSQLDEFRSLSPDGLSVINAEGFRKWMNEVWSPDYSRTLAKVKQALDEDVFKTAGEDIYAAGRKMHQLEKQLLDDPKGISKLMDADPYAPINRTTPYQKIPDAIINLSAEQFKHIIDTYKNFPAELQPQAQQAINTIKAHYGDKLLAAGTETGAGNLREMWNSGGVNTIVRNNSAKLPMVFTTPEELARITNLRDAGNILKVDTAYKGAAAQAANAMKSGLMSNFISRGGGVVGGAAGAAMAGPFGGGLGAAGGNAVGRMLGSSIGERKALERAKAEIISSIRDLPPSIPPIPPAP